MVSHLHEISGYLGQLDVATIMVGAQHGIIGTQMNTPVDVSYLVDAVILLRYFEAGGEVRQAISVVKKRGSDHERTIREFRLEEGGIRVGNPLREFRGVLTGVPTYQGSDERSWTPKNRDGLGHHARGAHAHPGAHGTRLVTHAGALGQGGNPRAHLLGFQASLPRGRNGRGCLLLAEEAIADGVRDASPLS